MTAEETSDIEDGMDVPIDQLKDDEVSMDEPIDRQKDDDDSACDTHTSDTQRSEDGNNEASAISGGDKTGGRRRRLVLLAVLTVAIGLALGLGLGLTMDESISHLRSPPPASGSEDEGTIDDITQPFQIPSGSTKAPIGESEQPFQPDIPSGSTKAPIGESEQPFRPDIPSSPPKTTPLDDLLAGTERSSWPELVGLSGENAEEILAGLYGDKYMVQLVEFGGRTTMDFRTDRIFLFLDVEGNVMLTPSVGR
jgi:hypothetical protein